MIDLFNPPKIVPKNPSFVHCIEDDPDEPIEISAYQKRLEQMRAWHERKKHGNVAKTL